MRFNALFAVPLLAAGIVAQEAVPPAPPVEGALPPVPAEGVPPVEGALPTAAPGLEGLAPPAVPGQEGVVPPVPGVEGQVPPAVPVPGAEGVPQVAPQPIPMAMGPPTGVVNGVQTVIVGGIKPPADASSSPTPNLQFTPDSIIAQPGEIVRFMFMGMNHSVMQTTFEEPCRLMAGGVDSGFQPNKENRIPGPTFDFTVRDTNPVWMSCAQTGHCVKGMVFSINAAVAGDKTFAQYKQLAIKGNQQLAQANIANGIQQNQALPTTVTINVGGVGGGESILANTVAGAQATVVPGQGQGANGQTCSCQCLCGQSSFPNNAAIGQFGGFVGAMPA